MNTISFMSANYVARESGYNMTNGWGPAQEATIAAFQPIDTYAERFGEILTDIKALGFDTMDIWLGHLGHLWATPEHIAIAKSLLAEHGLTPISLAGGFGSTIPELEKACQLAVALDVSILGGLTPLVDTDYADTVAVLKNYGVKLGIENHPEKTPAELLSRLGDSEWVGATLDTGWFGTHDYDAEKGVQEVGDRLIHFHLKDVRAPGGHSTCRYGEGVVAIEACAKAAVRMGYTGAISVEHEPEQGDPTEDIAANFAMLKQWLEG